MIRLRAFGTAALDLGCVVGMGLAASCGPAGTPDGTPAGAMTYERLAELLRAAEADVESRSRTIDQPWSDVPGRALLVEGREVQVFEYESEAAARRQAESISPDAATIGTHLVDWVETVSFYRRERLIVLQLGESETVSRSLRGVLGPAFAGTGQAAAQP